MNEAGEVYSILKIGENQYIQSEMYDGELNCMGTVRSAAMLVVGSGTGPLYLYSGNYISVIYIFCKHQAIFVVNLVLKRIFVFRFFCAVGHHEDEFPIERLDVNISGDCC